MAATRKILPQLERLPAETQEEVAAYLEAVIEEADQARGLPPQPGPSPLSWNDPFGACRDLPDTLLEELDRQRHSGPSTPPLELP